MINDPVMQPERLFKIRCTFRLTLCSNVGHNLIYRRIIIILYVNLIFIKSGILCLIGGHINHTEPDIIDARCIKCKRKLVAVPITAIGTIADIIDTFQFGIE